MVGLERNLWLSRSCLDRLEDRLSIIGRGANVSTVSGPVGMDELARGGQSLVRMGAEVISLGLQEIGG